MSKAELKPHELMQKVADFLERESVPYRIVGSMASMAYGEFCLQTQNSIG